MWPSNRWPYSIQALRCFGKGTFLLRKPEDVRCRGEQEAGESAASPKGVGLNLSLFARWPDRAVAFPEPPEGRGLSLPERGLVRQTLLQEPTEAAPARSRPMQLHHLALPEKGELVHS